MIVKELIRLLSQFDGDNEVKCTWEGTINDIEVYLDADNVVMIDGDEGFYRVIHQELPCDVCGKPAKKEVNGSNVCYGCQE
jgi:hypothetical protein